MTIRAGVVGQPIGHSLSPLIHRAWLAEAGLTDARYDPFEPSDAGAFAALVARGRDGDLRGVNVTAPYKEQALSLADEAGVAARAAGSANLLIFQDGRARADSTDGLGLIAALAEQAPGLDLTCARAVVLGAGGAARAAVLALIQAGAKVAVSNRTPDRAARLVADVGGRVAGPDDLSGADLVVNALSVTPAIEIGHLRAGAVVMDMTYRPLETPFLTAARARGLTGVDGLAMLIGQARPSFQALFGQAPPEIDVRTLCLKALEAAR